MELRAGALPIGACLENDATTARVVNRSYSEQGKSPFIDSATETSAGVTLRERTENSPAYYKQIKGGTR